MYTWNKGKAHHFLLITLKRNFSMGHIENKMEIRNTSLQ